VADAAGVQAYEHFAGAWTRQIDVPDDERLTELLEHRRANPHRVIVCESVVEFSERRPTRDEAPLIIEKSMNSDYLSNTYLVADDEGGTGFFVDAGGPVAPLIDAAERLEITPTHVLLTHAHGDHVSELGLLRQRWPGIVVLIDPREDFDGDVQTLPDALRIGKLEIQALHTPGHTAGMRALVVGGNVFTGDTLFRNSVGGVRAPGSTSYADLRSSIMDTLMALPKETIVRPGHTDPSTVGEEWERNGFIRIWRGVDAEGDAPCTALGEPATLILLGDDYDGGHKAWVRWPDGRDDIVPGSKVVTS
jgi:hydroxyacylglutathione hydrolase